MFSDDYCLTKAVLDGTKTMTRRKFTLTLDKNVDGKLIRVYPSKVFFDNGKWLFDYEGVIYNLPKENYPRYKVGEVVAIAQSYHNLNKSGYTAPEWLDHVCESSAGYKNKMFVKAELMPHHIKITDVKVERLRDISDEDCTKEGVGAFLKVICEKASEEYEKKSDNIYWITGRGYDQSLSYCHNCARKEVEALNQKIGKGYEKYIIDGGWGVEDEHPCFCEKCGKPLLFDFCGNVDLELPNLDLRYESDLYILNQILSQDDEDAEKVIRYFAREAFASLIDKISGKGTWENNPFVAAYNFELFD